MTSDTSQTPSAWPYRTLLLCGHFGPATPASRRLNRDTLLAMTLLAVSVVILAFVGEQSAVARVLFAAAFGVSALWVLVAFRRYFSQLDELSLRIQYEGIAFAFGITLLLGAIAGAASVVTELTLNPLWVFIAEPLRGIGLVLAARRYR
jgi:hypothetical protein